MSNTGITSIPFEAQDKTRRRPTYASFGESGVTATANSYGNLLQITRYFGNKPSGFYRVDLKDVPEPCFVAQRMGHLQNLVANPLEGMRLDIKSFNTSEVRDKMPELSFLNNRWPNFITEKISGKFNTEVQYFISQETVYQAYTFTSRDESPTNFPEMTINAELFIRDIDFSNNSDWNKQETSHSSHTHWVPEGNHCMIRMHKIVTGRDGNANEPTQNTEKAVILTMWPFINDSPQKVRRKNTTAKYIITPGSEALDSLKKDGKITVTIAYTLHLASPSEAKRIPSPCPPMELLRKLKTDAQNSEPSFANLIFSGVEHLDFALKRNLEHILSVCSLPIGDSVEVEGIIQPIAITCGDMAGHRVANEASFSAFQFLLLAFHHLHAQLDTNHHSCTVQNSTCNRSDCQMRSRIWQVCRGHLKWITDQMETPDGLVHSHYWATGQPMAAKHDSSLSQKSLMETPFHIIKAAEFCRITKDSETLSEVRTNLKLVEIIKKWVGTLDRENKHGVYAFPRPRKEAPIHSFYFPDHAIIWWAAKSVEDLGLGEELQVKKSACVSKHKSRNMSYSSDEIRTNIIKRFTTENPVLKKRMVAISRSTVETRFLIREKETVLFSAIDQGLFDKSLSPSKSGDAEKIDVWANTVDCQAQHEDNQNTQWNHPLQFALAIIMSSNGVSINSKPAKEMMHYSKSVLLSSSSANGLFPGQLSEDKEPAIFMKDIMCNSYWCATFEVPYILWKHAKASSTNEDETNGSSGGNFHASIQEQFIKQQALCMTTIEFNQALENMFERLSATFVTPGLSTINGKLAIKKSVPFKNFIDQNNIVELQDEWMYNEPKFFDFGCNLSKDCRLKEIVQNDEMLPISEKESFNRVGNVIANTLYLIKQDEGMIFTENPIMGYIVDVPRGSSSSKEYAEPLIVSNTTIYEYVGGMRTPEKSKKRLFHFSKADSATALICYLASSERSKISSFFDRHAAYDKYFFDDVTPETNKWISEFHLSFYQILDHKVPSTVAGIPILEEVEYPHHPRIVEEKRISRAVISFRFDGDYFDRYWTCHFFEFNPKALSDADWELRRVVNKHFGAISKANPWRQRRVLELVIVGTMLQEILLSSQAILEEIKKSIQNSANGKNLGQQAPASALLDTFDLFSKIDNGRFVAISRLWYKFQHILQIVENDLQENLAKITLWNDRERARGHDKPRWTKSDERDYRPIISKLQAHNDHKYHELQRCYVNITSFNASLSTNLDKMRGDLELRGADDIRLFTYVTVIFLPVGFATGIFSMSDTPSRHTFVRMAITAVVALLVTVIALTNAKVLGDKVVGPILSSSRKALYSSVGRPLRIIYSALKIRLRPYIYWFGLNIYFPIVNHYTRSGSLMKSMEKYSRELFKEADNLSSWEKAHEDYQRYKEKMEAKRENDPDWKGTIAEKVAHQLNVRFRGDNKVTTDTVYAAKSS